LPGDQPLNHEAAPDAMHKSAIEPVIGQVDGSGMK